MMFFDDRLAMPGHLRRLGGRGRAPRGPPGEARPQHRARASSPAATQLDRAGRHLLDHLLLAVPRGPHLRHPRPPLRRPGGLERGHLGQRQRGPELRGRPSTSPTTSATTGPTSSSRPPPGCGTPGRTTPWCSTGPAASSPTPTRCTSSNYDGEWFKVRGPADRAPLARRAGRCCSRPARRAGAGTSPPAGPS